MAPSALCSGKKTFQNNPANGVVGPTSQIPGLSQSADTAPAQERTSGRRVGIFESDSDYVKLAKQGGHKGLSKASPEFVFIYLFFMACAGHLSKALSSSFFMAFVCFFFFYRFALT